MSFRKNRQNKDRDMKMLESNKDSISKSSRVPDPVTVRVLDIEAQNNPDKVPTGTVPEILSWVGDDKEKAKKALDTENEESKPRKGLITALTSVIEDK